MAVSAPCLPGARAARLAPRKRNRQRAEIGRRYAGQNRTRVRRQLQIENRHLQAADERQDHRLLVETAARQADMRRVGGKLVQGRIDWQPQSAPAAFTDVDLGPGMVVKGAANEDQADGDTS